MYSTTSPTVTTFSASLRESLRVPIEESFIIGAFKSYLQSILIFKEGISSLKIGKEVYGIGE